VLAAEKGAKIAAGFREQVTGEQVRAAALDGTIVDLLEWFDARAGDTFFIPAGTVHVIGAGLTICEIQQPSDNTYRIYDYGRGRELDLDRALAVVHLGPNAARAAATVVCPYFVTEPLHVTGAMTLPPAPGDEILIALEGEGEIGGRHISRGDVFAITVSPYPTEIIGTLLLMRTFLPYRRD
jgi:mannose-6-phosphate isomerase class I